MMNVAFKMMNVVSLKVDECKGSKSALAAKRKRKGVFVVLKMVNLVFKMMNSALRMMILGRPGVFIVGGDDRDGAYGSPAKEKPKKKKLTNSGGAMKAKPKAKAKPATKKKAAGTTKAKPVKKKTDPVKKKTAGAKKKTAPKKKKTSGAKKKKKEEEDGEDSDGDFVFDDY